MENIKEEQTTIIKRIHEIHCDKCGELIHTFNEYITGEGTLFGREHLAYYDFQSSVSLPNRNLYICKTMCYKCKDKEESELITKLEELGYSQPTV